jgi:hypothetical protein
LLVTAGIVVTAEIPASSGDEPHATFTETRHRRHSGGAAAATITACSSSSGTSAGSSASTSSSAGGRVTPSWWNNATAYPLKGVWVSAITAFHTAHLNVTIQNVPHQNEFFCHPDATYRDQPSKLKFVVGNA